jgi:hypothetical protein
MTTTMTTTPLTAPAAPTVPGGPRVTLWILRFALAVHALAAVAQPILAGRYLSGDFDALGLHGANGALVLLAVMVSFAAAVLYWLLGRGSARPAVVLAALFVAEIAQVAVGAQRVLTVHIPLGVVIVAAAVELAVWSFRPAARQPRRRFMASKAEVER